MLRLVLQRSLNANNIATVSASTKIADQAATCWATISSVTNSGFVTDVGVNHLVEVDTTNGKLIKELQLSNGNPGMIDLESAGNFIYALSPGNATTKSAVTVFDVSGGQGSKLLPSKALWGTLANEMTSCEAGAELQPPGSD